MPKREYFSFSERQGQFDKALIEWIKNLLQGERRKLVPQENEMRYRHGIKWATTYSNISQEEREMKVLEAAMNIKWDDIRNHKLEALISFAEGFVRQMSKSIMRMIYESVSEMCEKTGRTIEREKDKSLAEVYLESLKSVVFGVDQEGRVSVPTFHAPPKTIEALMKDMDSKGKEFEAEIQKVIQEKSEEALENERKRLERFKS